MFSAFWAMVGGPLFWIMLVLTVISGVGNFVQHSWLAHKEAKIEALEKDLNAAKKQRTALINQMEDIERQCERLAKYYENIPKNYRVNGDIDAADVIQWLRGKAGPPNADPASGETDHSGVTEDPGDRRVSPPEDKTGVDSRGWWRNLFR